MLSAIYHPSNEAAFVVPTSLYYENGEVSTKQVCIELSCVACEPLASGDNWTAYVQANALDYPNVKLNPTATADLTRLTGFDFAEAGGVFGPVLILAHV